MSDALNLTPEQAAELETMRGEPVEETTARWRKAREMATRHCAHQTITWTSGEPPHCDNCGARQVGAIWATIDGDMVVSAWKP